MIEITIPRQIGIYVRHARKEQGLTQKDLAQRAGVSERLVLSLELGDAPGIQLDKLMSIIGVLGIQLFVEVPAKSSAKVGDDGIVGNVQPTPDGAPIATNDCKKKARIGYAPDHEKGMLDRYRSLYAELSAAAQKDEGDGVS